MKSFVMPAVILSSGALFLPRLYSPPREPKKKRARAPVREKTIIKFNGPSEHRRATASARLGSRVPEANKYREQAATNLKINRRAVIFPPLASLSPAVITALFSARLRDLLRGYEREKKKSEAVVAAAGFTLSHSVYELLGLGRT